MTALGLQQTVFLKARKLRGHGRALDAQIVCQLLAIEGNVKFQRALPERLGREIGQKLFPCAALAHVGDLIVQLQIFPCQDGHKVPDEQRVLRAGLRADGEDPLDAQEHDLRRRVCDDADVQHRTRRCGKGLCKCAGRLDLSHDVPLAP